MHCPEVIVINNRYLSWTRYGRTDYKSRRAPLIERLNIFRYSLLVRYPGGRFIINRDGRAWLRISNILFRLRHLRCEHEWRNSVNGSKLCIWCLKRTTQSKGGS